MRKRGAMSWEEADKFLGSKAGRPLENNTRLEREDGRGGQRDAISVVLHSTAVVKIHRDGTYTLNSGGWKTVTTKDRINRYSPARVYSERGVWYVGDYEFADGMQVDANGAPFGTELTLREAADRDRRRLDRMVREYIRGYAGDVAERGSLTQPGPGDCWGCLMYGKGAGPDPRAPGAQPFGLGHLLDHFEERYYVPSLLANAIRARGYREPGVIWAMMGDEAKRGDTRMVRGTLSAYFRKLKPALLDEMRLRAGGAS